MISTRLEGLRRIATRCCIKRTKISLYFSISQPTTTHQPLSSQRSNFLIQLPGIAFFSDYNLKFLSNNFNMKSPLYVLAVLLPLATELALGSPTPETEFESLEERGRGGDKDWDGHPGWHDNNPCEVKRSYPYYKYPCDSSVTTGMSQVGATFMPSCRYQLVLSFC